MQLLILNGPNLNLLGKREPEVYGYATFDDYFAQLKEKFPHVTFEYFQSNVEGELINKLHEYGFSFHGIIFNPGGYTHTSIAIGDAVAAIKTPVIEVHISNVFAREEFRHTSFVAPKAKGSICGLGLDGYRLAVEAFLKE
ncbi:MAG: type II 3-dehydroquinate dehydratase [Bacteroidota bacterium]|nr:type II 3-dehydroquinate dehydratase [Bacteroidota bacterium]